MYKIYIIHSSVRLTITTNYVWNDTNDCRFLRPIENYASYCLLYASFYISEHYELVQYDLAGCILKRQQHVRNAFFFSQINTNEYDSKSVSLRKRLASSFKVIFTCLNLTLTPVLFNVSPPVLFLVIQITIFTHTRYVFFFLNEYFP